MIVAHIVAGVLALLSGAVALAAVKGGRNHRGWGMVFVASMIGMAALGTVIAVRHVMHGVEPRTHTFNGLAGVITLYLVVTGFLTLRRRSRVTRSFELVCSLIAAGTACFALTRGYGAATRPGGHWVQAIPALVFGTITALAVLGDAYVMIRRGVHGSARIGRHLWRMCVAMLIAAVSFFLGQAKVFPEPVRIVPLLASPAVVVLLTMVYWMVRVRRRTAGSALSTDTLHQGQAFEVVRIHGDESRPHRDTH